MLSLRPVRDPAELRRYWQASIESYDSFDGTWPEFRSLWAGFPPGLQVVADGEAIQGASGVWPLKQEAFDRLVSGAIREGRLTGASIHRSDGPFRCATWYVSELYVHPELRRTRFVAALLACHLAMLGRSGWLADAFTFVSLGLVGVENVSRRLGWRQIRSAEEMPDRLALYRFDFSSIATLRVLQRRLARMGGLPVTLPPACVS